LNPAVLMQWQYLIFLAPMAVSGLLLLLSSMRIGHHHGGHAGHGVHAGHGHAVVSAAPHAVHGHAATGAHVPSGGHAPSGGHVATGHGSAHHGAAARHHPSSTRTAARAASPHLLLGLFGVGRAPLPMVIEAFFLTWGMSGCIAVQYLLHANTNPSLAQMMPVIGIAAASGVIGARIISELISRLMPAEESSIVSRNGLYGLKGSVAFPVSETGGRIMVYDDYGSLHDESCRVEAGHAPIERGRKAMIMDCDSKGNLLVEEVPE